MFDINFAELLVLAAVAVLVLGPERLPGYAAQLGRLVREMRRMARGAQTQVRDELGPEFDDIDWRRLDPRQYDPRRIVRDALSDAWDDDAGPASRSSRPRLEKPAVRPDSAPDGHALRPGDRAAGSPVSFDDDAT